MGPPLETGWPLSGRQELPPPAAPARTLTAKPWQLSAALLRRSMSSPILAPAGAAAGGAGLPRDNGAAGGGSAGSAKGDGSGAASEGEGPAWSPEVEVEARIRLVMSLKRYFHAKRAEGLLSAEGLRLLDHACDVAIDRADRPLVRRGGGRCRWRRASHTPEEEAHLYF